MTWGNTNYSNNVPEWVQQMAAVGGYTANVQDNHGNTVYGLPAAKVQNTHHTAHGGWVHVTKGTGGVVSFTVSAAGSNVYANGETVTVSNATSNAVGSILTNNTGNVVSVSVVSGGGGWVNSSVVATAFNQEKHLVNLAVGGTPTGYANSDVIVASNGTINATATVVTNSTGGFVTANVTITSSGLWANSKANSHVSFAVANSSGGVSGGSGATFTANIGWTGASANLVPVVGGRSGRIFYETLDAHGSMAANGAGGEWTNLP